MTFTYHGSPQVSDKVKGPATRPPVTVGEVAGLYGWGEGLSQNAEWATASAVGEITALTWALEAGDPQRFLCPPLCAHPSRNA